MKSRTDTSYSRDKSAQVEILTFATTHSSHTQGVIFVAVSWIELVNASEKLRKINTNAVRKGCFAVAAAFPLIVAIAFFTGAILLIGLMFLLFQLLIIATFLVARRRLSKLLLEASKQPRKGDKKAEQLARKKAKVKVAVKRATKLTAHVVFWTAVSMASPHRIPESETLF